MKATKEQKKLIHVNTHDRDQKEEFVQWATEDVSKISCNDLSFDQANMILQKLGQKPHGRERNYYGVFDKRNQQHMSIVSLTRQLGWEKRHEKYGRVADMDRLGEWLQSDKAPISKPLMKMETGELSKTINALTFMVAKRFK